MAPWPFALLLVAAAVAQNSSVPREHEEPFGTVPVPSQKRYLHLFCHHASYSQHFHCHSVVVCGTYPKAQCSLLVAVARKLRFLGSQPSLLWCRFGESSTQNMTPAPEAGADETLQQKSKECTGPLSQRVTSTCGIRLFFPECLPLMACAFRAVFVPGRLPRIAWVFHASFEDATPSPGHLAPPNSRACCR